MARENLTKSITTLFPQQSPDKCRVCVENVVDGRWNYCSERCRRIARAVQEMFVWECVREKVLERDEYACQACGEKKADMHVDHIHRLSDGGHPFDESNLQTLCESCHQEKTAEENRVPNANPDITLADYLSDVDESVEAEEGS